jgi:fatty acid/phospholipid biosynthesis enzyme
MTDGRKMNEDRAMYRLLRKASDEICLEHGLSVIENPKGKRIPYNVYKAMQKGIKTKYDHKRLGGAPLLGVNKIVLKCHGNCKADNVAITIEQAYKLAKNKLVEKMAKAVK